MSKVRAAIKALPFVRSKADGTFDAWDVSETGDWVADNSTGREYAAALLSHVAEYGYPHVAPHVLEAMVKKGRFGGVEVGFATLLADAGSTHFA